MTYRYRIMLRPLATAKGGGWLAEVPELPGCLSDGDTPQQGLDNVMDAIACWIEAETAGRFRRRRPPTRHEPAARQSGAPAAWSRVG